MSAKRREARGEIYARERARREARGEGWGE